MLYNGCGTRNQTNSGVLVKYTMVAELEITSNQTNSGVQVKYTMVAGL